MKVKVEQLFGASIKFLPGFANEAASLYAVATLKGKHLFDVVVNNLTGDVKVVFPDTTEIELSAKAKMRSDLTANGVTSRPSSDSVKTIIYPRIIEILADRMGI